MDTFATIRTNIRSNLDDAGISYYSDADITTAMQNTYDDVAFLTQCIVKKTQVNFQNNLNYYDLKSLGISDYMQVTAIFSNNSNLWLKDDLVIKDFDRMRPDWENWTGQPIWWAPAGKGSKNIVIVPKLITATGNMDIYYWATAPVIVDTNTPLVAPDMTSLIENGTCAELLEPAEEFSKAIDYWNQYYEDIEDYASRIKNIAASDLTMLA